MGRFPHGIIVLESEEKAFQLNWLLAAENREDPIVGVRMLMQRRASSYL
jgi:hypothetical protein